MASIGLGVPKNWRNNLNLNTSLNESISLVGHALYKQTKYRNRKNGILTYFKLAIATQVLVTVSSYSGQFCPQLSLFL
jgi:hypothetical protein